MMTQASSELTELSEFSDAYNDDPLDEYYVRHAERLGERILESTIRDLEPRAAVTVSPTTTIRQAIQVMIEHHVGAVLVEKNGELRGIFTERDVLRRVVVSGIAHDCPVAEVMTVDPDRLGLDDDIAFALNRMIVGGYRHIPIVDGQGRATNILSLRNVVAFIVSVLPAGVENLPPEPALAIPHRAEGA